MKTKFVHETAEIGLSKIARECWWNK